ncbi:10514_t:CDS:2 [Paraglomus brasilianum]|uniref:10514_t:CDS:1 n=1 Tax=Paraglomus brasilianum TaxID=144538 RepID=A0A9N8VH10_9GLOM|nr:10514_t:CDS:2 [Paraglomus brasilianum]
MSDNDVVLTQLSDTTATTIVTMADSKYGRWNHRNVDLTLDSKQNEK